MQLGLCAGVIAAIVAWGLLSPATLGSAGDTVLAAITTNVGWFYLWVVLALVVFCAFLAFGRYGSLKLGADDEEPEFSIGSCFAMLFAAGMGTSLPIVRVAGASIIAANAWRLLNAKPPADDNRQALAEAFTPEHARRQAFYPLTFPIRCGPGSLSAAITVGLALHDARLPMSLSRFGGGMLALAVMGVVMFLAFRFAGQLLKPLGETGTTVFLRLTAFILLCLGVQIVGDGLSELLRSLGR